MSFINCRPSTARFSLQEITFGMPATAIYWAQRSGSSLLDEVQHPCHVPDDIAVHLIPDIAGCQPVGAEGDSVDGRFCEEVPIDTSSAQTLAHLQLRQPQGLPFCRAG